MSEDRTLTFSQREGYEEVPGPLRLEELTDTARIEIWNLFYEFLSRELYVADSTLIRDSGWWHILRDVHAYDYSQPLDQWRPDSAVVDLRDLILRQPFNLVFDHIEHIMRHVGCPPSFVRAMKHRFERSQLAYIVDIVHPATILPAATLEEGAALEWNLNDLRTARLGGASVHLRNAAKHINDGNWAGSVRESIHAVESVARQLDPAYENKSLGDVLTSLEKNGVLQHKLLKQALSKLYGFASGEPGIRHSLTDKAEASVTEDEAVLMLGVCASSASYLWRKHKAAAAP